MMGLMAGPLLVSAPAERPSALALRDFAAWMASEQRRVYSLCHHLLQDRDEADSATQDAFVKAYQALQKESAKELEDPTRWLTRIAVNTCLDRLRSRRWKFWKRRPPQDDERTILGTAASAAPGADDRYFARQIRQRLEAALEKLSPRQKAAFTLRHYEGLSLDEISAILELDIGTVKAHMHRAVVKLRNELRDLYGGSR